MTPLRKFGGDIEFTQELFIEECINTGTDKETALELYKEVMNTETWRNDLYIVTLNRNVINSFTNADTMYCLKISSQIQDKEMPWADAVLIKNQLVGKECSMVELFPTDSQIAEGVNHHQYYGFMDPSVKFPFGVLSTTTDDPSSYNKSPGTGDTLH